jgi:hypothetical protein
MNGIVAGARRTALLAPVAAALVLLVASAGAAGSYRDPTGDNNGAPDISNVAVTNDAAGTITFDIGIVNLPSPADVQTYLFLDTDQNGATGAPGLAGAEYVFVVDESDESYNFYRWNGSEWADDIPYSTVRVSSGQTNVHIVVTRASWAAPAPSTSGSERWPVRPATKRRTTERGVTRSRQDTPRFAASASRPSLSCRRRGSLSPLRRLAFGWRPPVE